MDSAGGDATGTDVVVTNWAGRRDLVEQGLSACDLSPYKLILLSALGVMTALFRVLSMSLFLPLAYSAFSSSDSPRGRFSALFEKLPLEEVNLTFVLAGTILFAGVIGAVLGYLTEYFESKLTYHSQTTLSRRIFRQFLSYGQAYSDRTGPNAQLRELRQFPRRLARQIRVLSRHLRAILEVTIYGVALLLLSWPAAVACFVALVGYYLGFGRLAAWIEASSVDEEDDDEEIEERAADVLLNLPLVRGAGTASDEKREWRKFQYRSYHLRKRIYRFQALINPARQLFTIIAMVVFVVVLSSSIGELQAYDVARFIIFFLLLRRLMTAFSRLLQMPANWNDYTNVINKYEKLMRVENKGIVAFGEEVLEPLRDPLSIEGLKFSYRKNEALNGVTVSFPANSCTAVLGMSGSGKSTLLKLVARQYELDGGSILLNRRPIEAYSEESLTKEIVYLDSEPQFFNKSIEYNLCYGLEDVASDEVYAALERAAAAEFVSSLEDGLQTLMGSQTQPFSRGQLQRLGIARVLLQRQASIFLLDEATSALDEGTEKYILEQLMSRPETTTLFVTHRTVAIGPDMPVVVFDKGAVVEEGARRELDSRPDSYFSKLRHLERPAMGDLA